MAKAVEGTIIWYREKFARGVVMIEGGRRYMFTKTELEDLEPDYQLEADLGIDTVKQAEIFSLLRSNYGMSQDESF